MSRLWNDVEGKTLRMVPPDSHPLLPGVEGYYQIFLVLITITSAISWAEDKKKPSCLSMSSFVPPSMASGVTRPPSHFWTSLDQLRTKLEGETTITLSISGLKSGLWRSRVHIRVMHCRVFPRPISSAMMHPYEPGILLPVTHSHKNFTPWRR